MRVAATFSRTHCLSGVAAGNAPDKSPTAEDFTDITELADEGDAKDGGEGEGSGGPRADDDLFKKGMAFAQAQLSLPGGSGLGPVSMETDDYDEDSEEIPDPSSQSLPSNSNEEELSLSQQPDSGYESLPLSDPASSLDPTLQDHTPQPTMAEEATPTSLMKPEGEVEIDRTGKIESAIPYLIPKDMTLEQLHAKVAYTCYCIYIHFPTSSIE